MSAMEQMLGNMLKSLLPPEVMSMLTPEKLQEFALRINEYLQEQKTFQDNTVSMLAMMNDKMDFLLGRDSDDDNGNSYCNFNGKPGTDFIGSNFDTE